MGEYYGVSTEWWLNQQRASTILSLTCYLLLKPNMKFSNQWRYLLGYLSSYFYNNKNTKSWL